MIFVFLALLAGLICCAEVPIVTYDALLRGGAHSFSQKAVDSYRALAYDEQRHQIIVGAKNHVFRLSKTLQKIDELVLIPAPADVKVCTFEKHVDCHIFINQLHIYGEDLFIFGISAYVPFHQQRSVTKFNIDVIPQETRSGEHILPSNPHTKVAYMFIKDRLFIGSGFNKDGDDFAIVATNITTSKPYLVQTKRENSWLMSPEFLGAFEEGEAVYFVFRELAVEASSSEDIQIYSRIGRICKNDTGGKHKPSEGYFVSFTKARLVCEGHDMVTAMAYNVKQRMLYASFTDKYSKNVAVCSFEFSAIDAVFDGTFHYRESDDTKWEDLLATDPSTVEKVEETCFGPRALDEAIHYHLMTDPIKPYCNKALFKKKGGGREIFSAIGFSKINAFEVYLADSMGNIWNFSFSACAAKPLEVWQLPPNVTVNSIYSLESILVLTSAGVISIPFKRMNHTNVIQDRHPVFKSSPNVDNASTKGGSHAKTPKTEHGRQINEKKSSVTRLTSDIVFLFTPVYLLIALCFM